MGTLNGTHSPVFLVVLCCGVVISGCSDPAVHEPEGPTLPTSNDRIVNAVTFGSPHLVSSVFGLYDNESGGYYFRGRMDGNHTIGTVLQSGQMGWSKALELEEDVDCLSPLSESDFGSAGAVVWVGGRDKDGDNRLDEGVVCLLGSGGEELDRLVISRPDARMWLNSVAVVESLGFIAVGGATVGGSYRPVVAEFVVGTDSMLVEGHSVILDELQDQYFTNVIADPDRVSPDQFVFYVSGGRLRGGRDGWDTAVQAVRSSRTGDPDYHVEWTVDIQEESDRYVWVSRGAFALHDGAIYFGGRRHVEKDPPPGDGGYWTAGILGAVSTGGSLNWLKTITASGRSDDYNGICVVGGVLYACGKYSNYVLKETGERHGFGWISVLEVGTGKEIHHVGLGSEEFSSGFNALAVEGSHAYCAGWTNGAVVDGGNQAWFVEVDLAHLEDASISELPGLSPVRQVGEQSPRPTGAIEDGRPDPQ